jgi:ankyrin repeat protein
VAIRPLEVKELAEVLAVDFDDAEGIPKLKPNWRWEDEEQALLTSCSSLITTVETEDSRVVQFSHFSVKEYLTSARLSTSSGDVSRYHINLEHAHTIMAQACVGILLQLDDHMEDNDSDSEAGKNSPLAGYAAQHWVTHAQFERVSSFIQKAMGYLFDPDKPYFAAWLQLHDIDTHAEEPFYSFEVSWTSGVTPLYYAALCGLEDVVEHLVVKYPQDVNTRGGKYGTPLVAALAGKHFLTANHLFHNGAQVEVRSDDGGTPLHHAAWYGDLEMVQLLLGYKANANNRNFEGRSPLHSLPRGFQFFFIPHHGPQILADIARLLLEHGVDANTRSNDGQTPLHEAAKWGSVEVVRVLLKHGADVGAEDNKGATPLHAACDATYFVTNEKVEVVRMLLGHAANIGAKDNQGRTPLHMAAGYLVEFVRVLLEHGANIGAKDDEGRTPYQTASAKGNGEIMKLLS